MNLRKRCGRRGESSEEMWATGGYMADPTTLYANSQCDATLEGLCAPPGSLKSQVTRFVDVHIYQIVCHLVRYLLAPRNSARAARTATARASPSLGVCNWRRRGTRTAHSASAGPWGQRRDLCGPRDGPLRRHARLRSVACAGAWRPARAARCRR